MCWSSSVVLRPCLVSAQAAAQKSYLLLLESIPFCGDFDVEMNCHLSPLVDVVNFSGREPRVREVGRCGFSGIAKVCYSYRQHREDAFSHACQTAYYLSDKLRPMPMILRHGEGSVAAERQTFSISSLPLASTVAWWLRASWRGFAKAYCYSIVAWNPDNENQTLCCA